jgi:hypothetical protein
MFDAIANIPASRLRDMRVEALARELMISLAANPKALELSEADVALVAFNLAEAFDDLTQARRK